MNTSTLTRTETPAPTRAWLPVAVNTERGPWARVGCVATWPVHQVDPIGNGRHVGDVWVNPDGRWGAHARGTRHDGLMYATRAEALAAVGWLDTVTALTMVERGVSDIILPNGAPAYVYAAALDASPAGAVVDFSATIEGPPVRMVHPIAAGLPWELHDMATGRRSEAVRFRVPPLTRFAVMPFVGR